MSNTPDERGGGRLDEGYTAGQARAQVNRSWQGLTHTLGYHVPQRMTELRRIGLSMQSLTHRKKAR